MSGVWVFKDGVVRVVNPGRAAGAGGDSSGGGGGGIGESGCSRHRVLVHTPSNEVITSYEVLETKLAELGWERYYGGDRGRGPGLELLQFHKPSSVHLISVPADFSKFRSVHMYDIVVKSRNVFEVRVVRSMQ